MLIEIPRHGVLEEEEYVGVKLAYQHLHSFGVVELTDTRTACYRVCDITERLRQSFGDLFVVAAGLVRVSTRFVDVTSGADNLTLITDFIVP